MLVPREISWKQFGGQETLYPRVAHWLVREPPSLDYCREQYGLDPQKCRPTLAVAVINTLDQTEVVVLGPVTDINGTTVTFGDPAQEENWYLLSFDRSFLCDVHAGQAILEWIGGPPTKKP